MDSFDHIDPPSFIVVHIAIIIRRFIVGKLVAALVTSNLNQLLDHFNQPFTSIVVAAFEFVRFVLRLSFAFDLGPFPFHLDLTFTSAFAFVLILIVV